MSIELNYLFAGLLLTITALSERAHSLGWNCSAELPYSPQTSYWVANVEHGISPFNSDANYKVFRNVKDYGAVGDGVTDDTAAINLAISDGNRCGHGCASSTVSPALVYFPAGIYLISTNIIQYYHTQMVGDGHDWPTLLMSADFNNAFIGLIDSDPYDAFGGWWFPTNNFFRQIRNFVIDTTLVAPSVPAIGIHWRVAQATSLTNIHFKLSSAANTQHQGVWMEDGSGGYMSDLTFDGGNFGLWVGNQQFTSRNLTFSNCNTAIYMNWNWAWTFKDITIVNCTTGIDMTSGGATANGVGSIVLMDSHVSHTDVAVKTVTSATSQPHTAGSLVLDNVQLTCVRQAVGTPQGDTILEGGNRRIPLFISGHTTSSDGISEFVQSLVYPPHRSAALLDHNRNFFAKSKPTYLDIALTDFVSVKSEGAMGDGVTDDTQAIADTLAKYAGCKVVYFPAGIYLVSDTVLVPVGSRVVGELWSVIMANGSAFSDANNPKAVFKVGNENDIGVAELSELLFTTAGAAPGAILVQINARDPSDQKGAVGLWDVHMRVGGASGTHLQSAQCDNTTTTAANSECFGVFLMLHITPNASACLDHVWAWVADHDIDAPQAQLNVYSARGILSESVNAVWMYGTSSEHSVLYQYQIANSRHVVMAMIQIETPYYQSSPPAPQPFAVNSEYSDPSFANCDSNSSTCPVAWALRVLNSQYVYVYGAGLYNFFNEYDTACEASEHCQDSIVSLENSSCKVHIYNLNTKSSDSMIDIKGVSVAKQADYRNTFCSTLAALLD